MEGHLAPALLSHGGDDDAANCVRSPKCLRVCERSVCVCECPHQRRTIVRTQLGPVNITLRESRNSRLCCLLCALDSRSCVLCASRWCRGAFAFGSTPPRARFCRSLSVVSTQPFLLPLPFVSCRFSRFHRAGLEISLHVTTVFCCLSLENSSDDIFACSVFGVIPSWWVLFLSPDILRRG